MEKVLDRDGNLTGEFRFDASNAIKALALIGKHVDVRAFENKESTSNISEEMVNRLRRGRDRASNERPQVDFLQPPPT